MSQKANSETVKNQAETRNLHRIPALVMMGRDFIAPEKLDSEILRKYNADSEIYLDMLNKYEVSLLGKKVGQYIFDELQKAERVPEIFVVYHPNEFGSIEEFLGNTSKANPVGLNVAPQGNTVGDNLKIAKDEFRFAMPVYVTGGDLPQAYNIDKRIEEIEKNSDGLKYANFLFGNIESFGSFWRNPLFLYNNFRLKDETGKHTRLMQGNQGYKEPNDFILDFEHLDTDRLAKTVAYLSQDRKQASKSSQLKLQAKLIYLTLMNKALKEGIEAKPEIRKIFRAFDEYQGRISNSEQDLYPLMPSGRINPLLKWGSKIAHIPINQVNVGASDASEFYKDVDSIQDLFRHAMEMKKQAGEEVKSYRDLEGDIRYEGAPILEHKLIKPIIDKIGKDNFYTDLKAKQIRMDNWQHYNKNLIVESQLHRI